jgi:hypothetical protein
MGLRGRKALIQDGDALVEFRQKFANAHLLAKDGIQFLAISGFHAGRGWAKAIYCST